MMQTNELIVIQVNCNSLVSVTKRTEFQKLLNKHKPHIVMLSETKIKNNHKLKFNEYKLLRNDRETNIGGGTAICHTETLDCEYVPTPKSITSFECCIAKLKTKNNEHIIFASIYKPPTAVVNGRNALIKINPNELNEIFKLDKNARFMIGGDFNAQHGIWNSKIECINGRKIAEWMQSYAQYYEISIYASANPTCKRSLNGTHIDFGMISTSIEIVNSQTKTTVLSEPYSDHAALIMKLKIEPKLIRTQTVKNYKKANWKRINS